MANQKFLITVLGLAVLLQLSFAIPVPDDDSKSTEASDEKVELEKFAVLEFNKVATEIVPKEIEVLKEVLKDLKADEARTEADDEVIKNIEELIKKIDDEDDDTKIALEVLFKILAVIDPYDEHDKPSKKNPKVHDLLEKHGWHKVRDEFDAAIEPKIDELGVKAKQHFDVLGADEKEKHKGLDKWIKKLEDPENDIGDKINLLLEFIADTDDSDESK